MQRRFSTASGHRRVRVGPRTQLACLNCKDRKLKCDEQIPSCANCVRFSLACLVEDPATKRHQPRNYVEVLEQRVADLEGILHEYRPDVANDHLSDAVIPQSQASDHKKPFQVTRNEIDAQAEDSEDLAHRVGMLSLNAAGDEPRYLGSSSSFALSRAIHSSLQQVVATKLTPSSETQIATFVLPSTCELPEPHIARLLSDVYFENIHLQYPFLHEPTVRAWELSLMGLQNGSSVADPDRRSLYFVHMVYAVGALLMPELGCSADQLYMTAQVYADYVLALDNIVAVQAILCCAVYSLRSSSGANHWKLAGMALRQCIDLGYHRATRPSKRNSKASPLHAELCKRVFWCAYVMDCAAGTTLGRPLGLPYQTVDCEYPLDIDDDFILEKEICAKPRTSHHEPLTKMSKAINAFRLRHIWTKIHSTIYSDTVFGEMSEAAQQAQVKRLRAELEEWKDSLPLIQETVKRPRSLFATSDWYGLNYNYTILNLYRPQITNTKVIPSNETFFECLQAAEKICCAYRRQFVGKSASYTWGALHELFLAGLTYLHCLWSCNALRVQTRPDHASKVCSDCTIVLVVISERWPTVAPYREIFEMMASRTITMMVDRLNDTSKKSRTEYSLGETESDSFPELIAAIADDDVLCGYEHLFSSFVNDDTS